MNDCELFTAKNEYVTTVEVPPFLPGKMPKVLIWGDRTFVHDGAVAHDGGRHLVTSYREAFACVSLTPSPGKPRWNPPPVDRSARTTLHGTPLGEEIAIEPDTGMQKDYVVLASEERAKGFVRPVRRSYKHEKCGGVTTMGQALAETYARDPSFYSGTFCATCRAHFPVGADGQFVWLDSPSEKVGT